LLWLYRFGFDEILHAFHLSRYIYLDCF